MRRLTLNNSLSDKATWHSYLPVYERLFFGLRNTPHSVAELGNDGGGGLLMLADYFENARVFGYDLQPEPPAIKGHPRIHFSQEDCYSAGALARAAFAAPYTVAIDDASHFLQDQQRFLVAYSQMLCDDGLLIVEDVQKVEHVANLAEALPQGFSSMLVDLRHIKGRFDDMLFVAWKT